MLTTYDEPKHNSVYLVRLNEACQLELIQSIRRPLFGDALPVLSP